MTQKTTKGVYPYGADKGISIRQQMIIGALPAAASLVIYTYEKDNCSMSTLSAAEKVADVAIGIVNRILESE